MTMNVKQLIAIAAVLSTVGPVFAQQTEYVSPAKGFVSTKSRVEVYAELKQSKADGSYQVLHQEYAGQYPQARVAYTAGRTRAELVEELTDQNQIIN
jgi:hypothetical protein